jgi:uncharacterized protein YdhG (YjbR/CyaY superfamily)
MPGMISDFITVDEYLSLQPLPQRKTLRHLRLLIRKAAPEAKESISFRMPAYKFHGVIAYFAGFKDHCSLFVHVKIKERYKEELKPYSTGKATLRFPADECLPDELVIRLIKESVKENLAKKQKGDKKGKG